MKKWKTYIFYLHDVSDIGYGYFDTVENNEIYAYTTKKNLADDFIKGRDMSKFYIKKVELNKKDLNALYHDYMNQELMIYEGITRTKKYKIKDFSCVLTKREVTIIEAMLSRYMHEKIYKYLWTDPDVFKDKYKEALDNILYTGLNKYITEGGDGIWEQTEGRMLENHLSAIVFSLSYLFKDNGGVK